MHSIFEIIRQYHMIEEGMRVVAGISGGADSVCLLYALCEYRKQLPFGLTVVHVEHGLRGEESLADAEFTRKLCERFGVPCHIVHAQVEERVRAEGISTEEAGRRERYRIFREIKEEGGAQRIAVAHNQNDQAETVLWNLARGSGLRGLAGMSPVRGDIIRPPLFTDRERIEQILVEAGLPWRTDRTNLQQDYTRNRIRLAVLPLMERELNAQAVGHIAGAGERLRQVQEYLDRVTNRAAKQCVFREGEDVCVRLAELSGWEELIREELLKRAVSLSGGLRDFGSTHLRALLILCGMDCGKELSLPGGLRAVREDGILRLVRGGGAEQNPVPGVGQREIVLPEPDGQANKGCLRVGGRRIRYELLENSPELMCQIIEKKYTKWLSYDIVKDNALVFRTRQTGDYLIVNREGGRKKLKDYLIDRKLPREQRDRQLLLTAGSHVLWIVGDRISEAAKVTKDTECVLKIQVEEELDEREDSNHADGTGSQREDRSDRRAHQ